MEELECGCAESQEWGLPMNPKYNKKHKEVKNEEFMVKQTMWCNSGNPEFLRSTAQLTVDYVLKGWRELPVSYGATVAFLHTAPL